MTTPGQPNPPIAAPPPSSPPPPPPAPAPLAPPATAPPVTAPPAGLAIGGSPSPGGASTPTAPRGATPPAPPNPPKPPKPAGSAAAGAYLLAVVALVIAVAAGAAAAYAVKTAWDVRDANTDASASATPSSFEEPTPTDSATSTSSASATAGPTPTQATPTGPTFLADFVNAEVNVPVPATSSCNVAYVDVDTLAVGDAAAAGHEFYLTTCGSPLRIFLDRTSGRAISTTPSPTPAVCYSRVTGTPTSELELTVEAGLTFCLLTNRAQANAQSLPQRLVIVNVESVNATQARLVVSTYRIS